MLPVVPLIALGKQPEEFRAVQHPPVKGIPLPDRYRWRRKRLDIDPGQLTLARSPSSGKTPSARRINRNDRGIHASTPLNDHSCITGRPLACECSFMKGNGVKALLHSADIHAYDDSR